MKTLLIATVMIATISFAGIQTVSAHGGNFRGGNGYCDDYAGGNTHLYDRTHMYDRNTEDYEKFRKETADIRKDIAVKRSELRALNRQDNPDEKRVAQLTGELFDLEEKLSEKAAKTGIDTRSNHGPSMMRDGVRGRGRHMMDW